MKVHRNRMGACRGLGARERWARSLLAVTLTGAPQLANTPIVGLIDACVYGINSTGLSPNGVLTVNLPKREESKPRQVKVSVNSSGNGK